MKLTRLAALCLVFVLALPAAAKDAFEIAGRAPKDSLMVLAWVGADQAKAGFEKTHLGELYNEPEVNTFLTSPVRSLWQALMQEIGKDGNETKAQAIEGLLSQLWHRPGLICVMSVKPTDESPTTLGVAAEWLIDDPDNTLRDMFKEWMKKESGDDVEQVKYGNVTYRRLTKDAPLYLAVRKRTWILAMGDQAAEAMAKKRSGDRSFLASAQHKRAAAALGDVKPWLYCAVNTEGLTKQAMDGFLAVDKLDGSVQDAAIVPLLTSSATAMFAGMLTAGPGMMGSGEFAAALGCDGKLLTRTSYAKPAEEHTWLFDYIGHKSVDAARLKEVPASADSFSLCTVDARKMFDETIDTVQSYIADAIKRTGGEAETPDLRAQIKAGIGVDLSDELFAQLGDHLLMYTTDGGSEGVLAVDIKSREAIEGVLVQTLQKGSGYVQFTPEDIDGGRLFNLSFAGAAANLGPAASMLAAVHPTIGVSDNRLILSMDPAAIKRYLKRVQEASEGGDDARHPAVKKFLDEHKDTQFGMIAHEDEAKTFTPAYQQLAGAYAMVQMAKKNIPIQIDFAPLPPPAAFTKHMAQTTTWIELKDGMRVRHGQTGASMSADTAVAGGVALGASIMLPSLARARELSKRTVCMANMRGIGQALYIYAQDDGRFPPNLEALVEAKTSTMRQFHCPSSDADEEDIHACYEYIPGITTSSDPTLVVLYEINNPHQGEGGNVLFQDGHVEFIKPYSRVLELVEQTKQKLAEAKDAA